MAEQTPPNVLFILCDEWRGQALGYAGDPNVKTPNLDKLAAESWRFDCAVSNIPVCCPMRATLMTGMLPDRHGVFTNDVHLDQRFVSMADGFNAAGYRTGWIGKWHLDGFGRKTYIPPERRQRFHYFEACECCHNYNNSTYYKNDDPTMQVYEGYDAFAQTDSAVNFIREQGNNPFALVVSYGPPHFPLHSAPQSYQDMYDPQNLSLRHNVDESVKGDEKSIREDVAGYYAHCSALDDAIARLMAAIQTSDRGDNTLIVFTSDHGDMLYSHGNIHKQKPYDESILVPLLIKPPSSWNCPAQQFQQPVGLLDLLPTINGLCGLPQAQQFQGRDLSTDLRAHHLPEDEQFIAGYGCFGEYTRSRGGREWRGIRHQRYTYVQDLNGPWLLFDNHEDPYQLTNLVDSHPELVEHLSQKLDAKLALYGDEFLPEQSYLDRWGWPTKDDGTVPYGPHKGVGMSSHGNPTLGIPATPSGCD